MEHAPKFIGGAYHPDKNHPDETAEHVAKLAEHLVKIAKLLVESATFGCIISAAGGAGFMLQWGLRVNAGERERERDLVKILVEILVL